MKVVCLIPARLESTRLPEKLIQQLGDKTVIQHTYLNASATSLFDKVIVVGNHFKIQEQIIAVNGNYIHSTNNFECGTDRIASVIKDIEADIVVNLQGDEPFVNPELLSRLIDIFKDDTVQVASLMYKISEADADNPNFVKVVTDVHNNALLFSRSKIPYNRDKTTAIQYYKHVGIYAFRKNKLIEFAQLPIAPLEHIEKLENLRFLQNGIAIRILEINEAPVGIDTLEDLHKARQLLT